MTNERDRRRLPVFFYYAAMTAKTKTKKHWGSTLDDFLKEEGIYEEAKTQAAKEMIAGRLRRP